jgi:hypothetical protein
MKVDSLLALGGALVVLAGVAVALKSQFTSQVIGATGSAFSNAIKAASAG